MKFENVKVDDTVYVDTGVEYGWNKARSFTLPKKVIKITKTQFVIEGGRRFRKNGTELGTFHEAYEFGESLPWSSKNVKDETEEFNYFKTKLKVEKEIMKSIESIDLKLNSGVSVENLKVIASKIIDIKQLIK